jgi:general secretion pathway protein D
MNKLIWPTLSALCVAGLISSARAQDNPPTDQDTNTPAANPETPPPDQADTPPPPDMNAAPPDDNTPPPGDTPAAATNESTPGAVRPADPEDRPAAALSAAQVSPDLFQPPSALGTNVDELRLNFRNAPLEMVLNYLSDAAGFIILIDPHAQVAGNNVSVISGHPMTRVEAVDLLNSVLNKSGLAAIRHGRELNIVDKNDAKTRDIPVKVSNDPDQIPNNAEIVTQIIPVRFVEAEQLVKDLSSFVSSDATIVANEAGNSIVITDTQSNIRHLVEIIKAVDSSAEGETQIRVFHLSHANPTDVANELAQIFPSNNGSTGSSTAPIRFGGGPGGGGGFFARMMAGAGGGGGGGGAAAGGAGGNNSRMQKQTQVLATADLRTSSVIVTASKDLMSEIEGMMAQLDVASNRDQKVYVFHMNNGDTMQDLQVLQSMFGGSTSSSGSRGGTGTSTTGSALGTRETQNASSSGTGSTTTGGSSGGIGGGMGGGGNRGGY